MRAALVLMAAVGCAPLWSQMHFTDPHGFSDAAAMYHTPAAKPFDDVAAALVKRIDARLRAKMPLEDERVWPSLVELNSYRKSPEVQAAVVKWASFYADELRFLPASHKAGDEFTLGNTYYRRGEFEDASQEYRRGLATAWGHYDERNNLALAQMRHGMDLVAEMELLTLRHLSDSYLPAAVNLTVVYERLGMEKEAREQAEQALNAGKDIPQAVFNAAWYKDVDGQHKEALALLTPVAEGDTAPASAKSFKSLLDKILEGPGFWTVGMAGRAGVYGNRNSLLVFLISFGVASVIIMAIAGGTCSRRRKPAFFTFVTFAILYLVFWGLPGAAWLAALALYVIVFLSMARRMAASH